MHGRSDPSAWRSLFEGVRDKGRCGSRREGPSGSPTPAVSIDDVDRSARAPRPVVAPITQGAQDRLERSTLTGQRIDDLGGHLVVYAARHELIRLELSKLLSEHLLANPGHEASQLSVTPWPIKQIPQ